jgi:tRNA(His) 5'-end guanylyltransferase
MSTNLQPEVLPNAPPEAPPVLSSTPVTAFTTELLSERMLRYEGAEAMRSLPRDVPVLARLDGCCFSSFTRRLHKPYDPRLGRLMVETTHHLVEKTAALAGYTQSDEITLLWHATGTQDPLFGGRVAKICSRLAARATGFFVRHLDAAIPEKAGRTVEFDCRAWTVPDRHEAANVFLWREIDAETNAVSAAARAVLGRKTDTGCLEAIKAMRARGFEMSAYPEHYRRGVYIVAMRVPHTMSDDEVARLPEVARKRPDFTREFLRRQVVEIPEGTMPRFMHVANRVEVLFEGAEPVVRERRAEEDDAADAGAEEKSGPC